MDIKFLLFFALLWLPFSGATDVVPGGMRRALLNDADSSVQDELHYWAASSQALLQDYPYHLSRVKRTDIKAVATSGGSWSHLNNTFCRGPKYADYTKTRTLQECQSACTKAIGCWMYSWCDSEAGDGCQVYTYPMLTQNARTEDVEPGTCVLSGGDQLTYVEQQGDAWTCGMANQTSDACSSVRGCNILDKTLVVFSTAPYLTFSARSNILTVEACCAACQVTGECNFFMYCNMNSSSCRYKYRDAQGNIVVVTELDDAEPGTCWLMWVDLETGMIAPVVGDCPFASGTTKDGWLEHWKAAG